MATDLWRDPTKAVRTFGAAVGIAHLAECETLDAWTYSDTKFATTKLGSRADFKALITTLRVQYSRCVTFTLRLGALPLFSLDADLDWDRIAKVPMVDLYLKIDKSCLLAEWGFNNPNVAFRLFFFPTALERTIAVPLPELEAILSPSLKNILLIPDQEIELTGPYLTVLGGDVVGEWLRYAAPIDAKKTEDVYIATRKLLKWVHSEVAWLTPLHLALDWTLVPKRDDVVAGVFFVQWTICSLLYLAEQSRWNPKPAETWLVTFAADKYLAQVAIGRPADMHAALLRSRDGNPGETAKTIGILAQWVYGEDRVADRLTVLQAVVANALEENAADVNGTEILRHAGEIAKRVEAAWKAFIQQKLDKFFGQLKQLEEAIEATSRAYNEQVQALTKGLIDNMLAAVAVIVGSFIAAMFKSPFQAYVFWFGAGVYLVYLLVFPIIVGLFAAWQRFADSCETFRRRTVEFGKRLTPEQVEEIVGTAVSDRERWFRRWFGVTLFLYVVVFAIVLASTIYVPDRIRTWSDYFVVTEISYEKESNGVVPVLIRGQNFDKDKEIVVFVGGSTYTNTDGETLKVNGSTVLSLSVPRKILRGAVIVRQGELSLKKELPRKR